MNNEKIIQQIKEKLEAMVGHQFKYGGKTQTIASYFINEEKELVTIKTDKSNYERRFDSVHAFLKEMEAIEEERTNNQVTVHVNELMLPKPTIDSGVIRELKDVLMQNIRDVKNNKDFIPQAESVKANVDSVIDLAKIEVAYMNAYIGLKNKK